MIVNTKETNDVSRKEVVGVIEEHNYAVEVQIYYVPTRNARVVDVEGAVIDFHHLVEVIVGHVEGGSLIGQKFKKFVEDIGVGSGLQDNIFVDMHSLQDVHELDYLLQKGFLAL